VGVKKLRALRIKRTLFISSVNPIGLCIQLNSKGRREIRDAGPKRSVIATGF
jgi:hypothetical protein